MVIYRAEIDPSLESDIEVTYIALVDRPAIEKHFLAFKQQTQKAKFILNEDQRIISGPAMIADLPIYRNDEHGEYYVVFDKPAIREIATKFAAKGYMRNINLFHDDKQRTEDVIIFNFFVSDKVMGIHPMDGFEDLADGSLFISCKVNDENIWKDVKEGKILGYSVEGLFNYIPVAKVLMTKQQLLSTINNASIEMTVEDFLEIAEALQNKVKQQ